MEHAGIVVDDLAAATEFFVELGLVLQGEGPVEGRWVDRVAGLEGVRADIAIMQTPDGNGRLELTKFHSPSNQGDNRHAPANTPGIRHVAFGVEDIDAVVAGLRARGAELVGELERYGRAPLRVGNGLDPLADLLRQLDDDSLRAADVAEPVAVLAARLPPVLRPS
jgi:catechol 2,3-dioxygenase-like lactoylglutathione lyase family enzyme